MGLKTLNLDLNIVGVERNSQLSELEEIRAKAYENYWVYGLNSMADRVSSFVGLWPKYHDC